MVANWILAKTTVNYHTYIFYYRNLGPARNIILLSPKNQNNQREFCKNLQVNFDFFEEV